MITCSECGATFKNAAGLGAHKRFKHNGEVPAFKPEPTPEIAPETPEQPEPTPTALSLGGSAIVPKAKAAPVKMTREQIEASFPKELVAEIARNASKALSDWDGAGPEGVFSPLEAHQIAVLLHSSIVTMIERFFGGDAERAKMVIALALILVSKGRVHAKAISAKNKAKNGANEAPKPDAMPAATEDLPTTSPSDDWIKQLAAAQHRVGAV